MLTELKTLFVLLVCAVRNACAITGRGLTPPGTWRSTHPVPHPTSSTATYERRSPLLRGRLCRQLPGAASLCQLWPLTPLLMLTPGVLSHTISVRPRRGRAHAIFPPPPSTTHTSSHQCSLISPRSNTLLVFDLTVNSLVINNELLSSSGFNFQSAQWGFKHLPLQSTATDHLVC